MNSPRIDRRLALVPLLALVLALSPVCGDAAEGETVKSADGRYDYTDARITSYLIQQAIDEVWQKIEAEKKQGKLELRAIKFAGFRNKVNYYAQYPDIEKETKVAKTWFTKIVNLLNDMYRSRKLMEIAVLKKDREAYNESKAAYVDQLQKLEKLKNNPEKLDPSTRRRR